MVMQHHHNMYDMSESFIHQNLSMFCNTQKYISCLKDEQDKHHLCRELSKDYLQCRMDRQLMASEDLDKVRHNALNTRFSLYQLHA